MPAAPLIVALLVAAAAAAGEVALALDPGPFSSDAALLFAVGMVPPTVAAVAGILLSRGRWAGRLGAVLAAAWIAAAATTGTPAGLVAVALAAAALAAALGPWLSGWLRGLPSADGVPPAAVVVLVALMLTPPALAAADHRAVAAASWVFSGWSLLLALWLARTAPGALLAVRVLHPAAAVAAAIVTGLPEAMVITTAAVVVSAPAWRRDLGRAIAPVLPAPGPVLRIPPELAPPAVLEAAGRDQTGREPDPR